MPRVSTKTIDEEVKPAPRKRAVRRVVTKDDSPAPRKRAPRKVVKPAEEEESVRERKAPTRFASEATSRTKKRKTLVTVLVSLVTVTALAAWIGSTDAGQINVNAKIDAEANRQPQATQDVVSTENGDVVTVPVQNTPPPPAAISGLRGRGVGTAPVEQAVPQTDPATTTEETASSTESGSAEESTAAEEAPTEGDNPTQ